MMRRVPTRAAGFTLIELLLLIVVFSGSLVSLLSVSRHAAQRIAEVDASARAMQYAQERIEMVNGCKQVLVTITHNGRRLASLAALLANN